MKKIFYSFLIFLPVFAKAQIQGFLDLTGDSSYKLKGLFSGNWLTSMKDSTATNSLSYMKFYTCLFQLRALDYYHIKNAKPLYLITADDSGSVSKTTMDSVSLKQSQVIGLPDSLANRYTKAQANAAFASSSTVAWVTTYPTKALGTGWRPSTTKNANYDFTVSITTVASLLGLGGTATQLDTVYVDTSPDSSTWTNYCSLGAGQTATVALTLSLTQVNGGVLHVLVPMGYYVRIRRSGSGSSALLKTSQTLMKEDDWAILIKASFAFSGLMALLAGGMAARRFKPSKPSVNGVAKEERLKKIA